jgi:hypothetical protein
MRLVPAVERGENHFARACFAPLRGAAAVT